MATVKKEKHGWIRGALMDANLELKDVAKAWKITPGPVTRWIQTGAPELTAERAGILAAMIGMTREELLTRVFGGGTPLESEDDAFARRRAGFQAYRPAPVTPQSAPGVALDGVLAVLTAHKELEAVAARVQATLPPGLKVVFSIEKE